MWGSPPRGPRALRRARRLALALCVLPEALARGARTSTVKVCTNCDGVACSTLGPKTLRAIAFLAPHQINVKPTTCLARCDKGVVVAVENNSKQHATMQQQQEYTLFEKVSDPRAAAALLRKVGYQIDPRLVDAFTDACRGDDLAEQGRYSDALNLYNKAFGLATAAGLGMRWRSRPSSVLRVRQSVDPEQQSSKTGLRSVRAATSTQVRWLSSLMVSRSRAFANLGPNRRKRNLRRALEDALYAVQLSKSASQLEFHCDVQDPSLVGQGEASTVAIASCAAAWERLAETYEASMDIEGAISAYEELLRLEPPFSPSLSPATSAKRGIQELVLYSHRRGLEDAQQVGKGIRQVAETGVESMQAKALADVEGLRRLVNKDIESAERWVIRREQQQRKNGLFSSFVSRRAKTDLRTLRKVATSDINALELQILRGDPTVSLARWALFSATRKDSEEYKKTSVSEGSEEAFWLREQFEKGALPRDPVLVRSLLERAKREPELVARLITEAKDTSGMDLYERVTNDVRKFS